MLQSCIKLLSGVYLWLLATVPRRGGRKTTTMEVFEYDTNYPFF